MFAVESGGASGSARVVAAGAVVARPNVAVVSALGASRVASAVAGNAFALDDVVTLDVLVAA